MNNRKLISSLKQVADHAKVSTATVSRVINDDLKVSIKTRLKVQRAIEELNYQPNRSAQRLRSTGGKAKLLGLIVPDIQNPFYVDVIRGVEEYAYQNDYAVMIGNFSQNEKKEKLYLGILKSENVDGFIIAPTNDKNIEDLIKIGFPLVCIDRSLTNIDADVVKVDNEEGSYLAIKHLLGLGHTEIGFISGSLKIPTYVERLKGYKKALSEADIKFDKNLIFEKGLDYQSGVQSMTHILDLEKRPSAVFATNNLLALGALETIHKRKVKIPNELSFVGFDDMYWAMSLNPPLTAVRQPGMEIGRSAAKLLLQRILEPKRPIVNLTFKTELMIRNSTSIIEK